MEPLIYCKKVRMSIVPNYRKTKNKNLNKLLDNFCNIDNVKQLDKNKLTLAEYADIFEMLSQNIHDNKLVFFNGRIANYFKKFKIKVELQDVNYVAYLEE